MKPIQHMLSIGMQIPGQVPDGVAAIGEESERLIGLHPLGLEDFKQAALRFGIVALHEAKALRSALCGHTFPNDHLKPAFLPAGGFSRAEADLTGPPGANAGTLTGRELARSPWNARYPEWGKAGKFSLSTAH
jgi:hypothetical protein